MSSLPAVDQVALSSVPPNNIDLERAVLQMVLTTPSARPLLLDNLEEGHFYHLQHQMLWQALQALDQRLHGWDMVICGDELRKAGTVDLNYVYATILVGEYWSSPTQARRHIRALRELHRERRKREIGIVMASAQANGELPALLDELRSPVWQEEESKESSAEELANAVTEEWNRVIALKKSGKEFSGFDCGFGAINHRLNGLSAGELTVLAARPKIGKSTMALQMALHVARYEQRRVGIISLEMTKAQIGSRMACFMADVNSKRQRRGDLNEREADRFGDAIQEIARLPVRVWVKDRHIRAIVSRIQQEKNVDLWIVDHLHRVHGEGTTDHERYGSSTERLASLAADTGKHIILLSQLNRDCEERTDKRPQVGDLRGSGSIEEHAVNVLMIYRPGFYRELRQRCGKDTAKLEEMNAEVEIICEATRFEEPGTDRLSWVPDRGIFANLAPTYTPHYTER